jgi:hypothetical protein
MIRPADKPALDDAQDGVRHLVGYLEREAVDLVVDPLGPQHFILGLRVDILQRDKEREGAARSKPIRHEIVFPLMRILGPGIRYAAR